jgi:hypothetical protein
MIITNKPRIINKNSPENTAEDLLVATQLPEKQI